MTSASLCSFQRLAVYQLLEDWLLPPNCVRGEYKMGGADALEKVARLTVAVREMRQPYRGARNPFLASSLDRGWGEIPPDSVY
jgi:hypothetical protein